MYGFKKIILAGLCCCFLGSGAFGDCVIDQGPYEDNYGFSQFPFYNQCDESLIVNLCVKSFPQGSDQAVYNLYSGTNYGRSSLTLSDGTWASFDSYRWVAGGPVDCPFYD